MDLGNNLFYRTILFIVLLIVVCIKPIEIEAQVNDEDAFYHGTYQKEILLSFKIKEVAVSNFINGDFSSKSIYQFNSNCFLTKMISLDTSDTVIKEIIFEYNNYGDQHRLLEKDFVLNKINETIFYKTYDNKQLVFDSSSTTTIANRYFYNDSGKIKSKFTALNISYAIGKYDYFYDEKGFLDKSTETMVFPDGTNYLLNTTHYLYNNNKLLIKMDRQEKATYHFEYFDNGLLKSKFIQMPEEFSSMHIEEKYSYIFDY